MYNGQPQIMSKMCGITSVTWANKASGRRKASSWQCCVDIVMLQIQQLICQQSLPDSNASCMCAKLVCDPNKRFFILQLVQFSLKYKKTSCIRLRSLVRIYADLQFCKWTQIYNKMAKIQCINLSYLTAMTPVHIVFSANYLQIWLFKTCCD